MLQVNGKMTCSEIKGQGIFMSECVPRVKRVSDCGWFDELPQLFVCVCVCAAELQYEQMAYTADSNFIH